MPPPIVSIRASWLRRGLRWHSSPGRTTVSACNDATSASTTRTTRGTRTACAAGDRVLVTLDLTVHEPARYVAVDDALPAILEAVNPEFKTREAGPGGAAAGNDAEWLSSFREIRKDRCLYFADWIGPGNYSIRYVARVRAAGTVTAPPAKIEEMYHPERYGLSGTQTLSSEGLQ